MKTITNKFLTTLLILMLSITLLVLPGCDGITDENVMSDILIGKYVLVSLSDADGNFVDMEVIKEISKESGGTVEDFYNFEFFVDGSCSVIFEDMKNDREDTKYTKKGSAIIVYTAGDESELLLDGSKLTWNYPGGATLIYEKQQ